MGRAGGGEKQTYKIKTVAVALQLPLSPCRAVLPAQLLGHKQAVVARDALDARAGAVLVVESADLVHVQPVAVVEVFEVGVEASVEEARVEGLEAGKDACE